MLLSTTTYEPSSTFCTCISDVWSCAWPADAIAIPAARAAMYFMIVSSHSRCNARAYHEIGERAQPDPSQPRHHKSDLRHGASVENRVSAGSRDLLNDRFRCGHRIRRGHHRTANHEIVGAGLDRRRRRHDALLVVGI